MVAAFKPLMEEERQKLFTALRGNAENGLALEMDPRNTSFVGSSPLDTEEEEAKIKVMNRIKSVPSHY